jgi:hypothetical protein
MTMINEGELPATSKLEGEPETPVMENKSPTGDEMKEIVKADDIANDPTWRRSDINRHTPAEKAIRDAVLAVEQVGADPSLTDAVQLLTQAQAKVADYVDAQLAKQKEAKHPS